MTTDQVEGIAPDEGEPDPNLVLRGRSLVIVGLIALVIGWLARPVIGPFIVAAVIAYAFSPVVTAAQARSGLPRVAIVAIGYLLAVLLFALLDVLLVGQLLRELELFNAGGPDALANALRQVVGSDTIVIGNQHISIALIAHTIQADATSFLASPTNAVELASRVGEVALKAILVVIVTFYFLVDGASLRDRTIRVLPLEHRTRTIAVLGRIHAVLGKWLRGQLLLMALVALVVYVVIGPLLHLPYALAIAALTGILEIIPLVGPLIATTIAGIDAFAHDGAGLALAVVAFYFVVRQVEDQVVMPVVVGRAVHLHPVVTIFAVLVGLSTYGVLGGLLGVPIAAAVNVIFRELGEPEVAAP
jgi:predicted PurR-regulated permease PerM